MADPDLADRAYRALWVLRVVLAVVAGEAVVAVVVSGDRLAPASPAGADRSTTWPLPRSARWRGWPC